RRISREGRSKIWTHQITRGRAQWREGRVANRGVVAITPAGRSRSGIGFANRGNRSPKIVGVFRFPYSDGGIGHADIDQSKQTSQLHRAQFGLVSDVNSDLVV